MSKHKFSELDDEALSSEKIRKKQKLEISDSVNQELIENQFHDFWESNYFVVRNEGQAVCLVCRKALPKITKSDIERHFEEFHEEQFSECTGEDRLEILKKLRNSNCLPLLAYSPIRPKPTASKIAKPQSSKADVIKQESQSTIETVESQSKIEIIESQSKIEAIESQSTIEVIESQSKIKVLELDEEEGEMTLQERRIFYSYSASLRIASEGRSYSYGGVIKKNALKYAQEIGNEKMISDYNTVALSRLTVKNRISDINLYIIEKTKSKLKACSHFSLLLHESIHRNYLMIFARIVQNDFTVNEELLSLLPLKDSFKDADIFDIILKTMGKFCNFQKCSAVAIHGRKFGIDLANLMEKCGITCPKYQCHINLEILSINALANNETIEEVKKITNLILTTKKKSTDDMKIFAKKSEESYKTWALKSELQWLCEDNCFEKIFKMREDIIRYLKSTDESVTNFLEDPSFLSEVAFLADLTTMIEKLILNLQLPGENVADLVDYIQEFREKLQTLARQIKQNDYLDDLPCCSQLSKEISMNLFKFLPLIENITEELNLRFRSLDEMEADIKLFQDPRSVVIECQREELQFELFFLREDVALMATRIRGIKFYEMLSQKRYPKLRDLGLRLFSMFGSVHIGEKAQSIIENYITLHRSDSKILAIEEYVRIGVSNTEINIPELMRNKKILRKSR